jgi:hypothetical protein
LKSSNFGELEDSTTGGEEEIFGTSQRNFEQEKGFEGRFFEELMCG